MSSSKNEMSLPARGPLRVNVSACDGPSTRPHGVPVPSPAVLTPIPWSKSPTAPSGGAGCGVIFRSGGIVATHFFDVIACCVGEPLGGTNLTYSPSLPRCSWTTPSPSIAVEELVLPEATAPGSSAAPTATAPTTPMILVLTVMVRSPSPIRDLRRPGHRRESLTQRVVTMPRGSQISSRRSDVRTDAHRAVAPESSNHSGLVPASGTRGEHLQDQ